MNRQRGFIPISLIMYAVAALAVMAALATLVYKVNHWCNAACTAQTERADAAEASINAAQDRATAMALLWDKERQGRESDARQRETDRTARFAPILAASRSLPADVARVRFPDAAARVLDDAINASNARLAGPASEPAKEAATAPAAPTSTVDAANQVDVASVTQWGVTCASMYAASVDQILGWQDFYQGLRQAQLAEN